MGRRKHDELDKALKVARRTLAAVEGLDPAIAPQWHAGMLRPWTAAGDRLVAPAQARPPAPAPLPGSPPRPGPPPRRSGRESRGASARPFSRTPSAQPGSACAEPTS